MSSKNYYNKNKEKILQNTKEYYLKNKVKIQKRKKDRYLVNEGIKSEYYLKNRETIKEKRQIMRLKCLEYYSNGTPKCNCCGESIYEFLVIDHINNNGTAHRKSIKGEGSTIIKWIIKNNFPPIFQILCHNCNMAKGFYGICPHQKLSTSISGVAI